MYIVQHLKNYVRRCLNKFSQQFQVQVCIFCQLIPILSLLRISYPLNASLRIQNERTVAEFIDPLQELKPV
jgi:hypothetical protein